MIAYMHKWITRPMESADPAEGQQHASRLMNKVYDNFANANGQKKRLFFYGLQERRGDEVTERHMIMDHLHYDGTILFGSIGIISMEMDGLIRERDIITFEESLLVPSSPSRGFEYYTYFGICASRKQLLILKNGNMPSYIQKIIVRLLHQAIEGEPYHFEVESYQEKTIREQIDELNKTRVEFRVALPDLVLENKASFRKLKAKADRRGVAAVSMKLYYDTKLDASAVDDLIAISDDQDVQRLVVVDAGAPSKEADAIDLLKEVVRVKRDVKIRKSDLTNIDFVWEKFCEAMREPTDLGAL